MTCDTPPPIHTQMYTRVPAHAHTLWPRACLAADPSSRKHGSPPRPGLLRDLGAIAPISSSISVRILSAQRARRPGSPRPLGLTVPTVTGPRCCRQCGRRGRGPAVTSKRRKGAGRDGRGMWGREVGEAGEAAVWEAASPTGRRPAHLGTSCSLGWRPRTCTQLGRLPQT